jgi:HEAT repeat protein
MTNEPAFQMVIDALLDAQTPFSPRYLRLFSDLEPARLKLVLDAWPKVAARRKETLLEDLKDLAEADPLTNFDDLGRALLADPDASVREQATRLLWECEDPKLIPVFLKAMQTDGSPEVRAASATALGLFVYLGELEQIPAKIRRSVEDALLKAAAPAETKLVRRRALEALGFSSRPQVPPLIEAAIHQKDAKWVESALFAMGRSSDERWEKHILSRLRHDNDDIRREATAAAGEIGLPSAREPLLDLLEDEEAVDTRHQIIWALSKIGGEDVRARLEELLEAEADDEEAGFIEEAMDNLIFMEPDELEMFEFDPDADLREEKIDD